MSIEADPKAKDMGRTRSRIPIYDPKAKLSDFADEDDENTDRRLEKLLNLARDPSAEGRAELLDAVGHIYSDGSSGIGARERKLIEDILRRLLDEVERGVRAALAERLADLPSAPKDLIWRLANDDAEVAFPILMRSGLLDDSELIEIVRHKTTGHRLGVAQRTPVAMPVSAALAESGEVSVIAALLANAEAHISPETFDLIADLARDSEVLQQPLVARKDLPGELARRLYWWVSAALRQQILANFDIDPDELDGAMAEAVTARTPMVVRGELVPKTGLNAEAETLFRTGAPAPELLVRLMRAGKFDLFEVVLARALDLRLSMLRRVLYEPGGQALAVGMRAIGIAKPDFAAIFLWSRNARPGDKNVAEDELARALCFYDRVSANAARGVLRRWQRDPNYQEAIDAIGYEGAA